MLCLKFFSKNSFDIGLCIKHRFSIRCLENVSLNVPSRRIPMHLQSKVTEMISLLLKNDIMELSDSPYNSPLVIVPKKDNTIRLCVDFRELNRQTIKDNFHIPNSQEIFDSVGGNSYFSTIDLSKGYHQIPLEERSKKFTAFSSGSNHYQFKRLPFVLVSALAFFQHILQKVLKDHLRTACFVYIDDIIIFGINKIEHDKNFAAVMNCLRENGLNVSPSKFSFCQKSVKFFGHIISEYGIETDPEKVKCIQNWPKPL